MTVPLHLIDAFADEPFTGNPAAVVWLEHSATDRWMQRVAMEMNQAETAFVQRRDDGFALRWFTPRSEVDLCGHATLASAHYLWENGLVPETTVVRFTTRSGDLTACRGHDGMMMLDFPAITSHAADAPPDLAHALGTAPITVLHGDFDLLCVVDAASTVRHLAPDLAAVARWPFRGVMVTARSDDTRSDFVSRCFFPALGVPEDPVTGSAHCALAVYWAGVLGRSALVGYQASARGGIVRCEVHGARVHLVGRAVTTLRGELAV